MKYKMLLYSVMNWKNWYKNWRNLE